MHVHEFLDGGYIHVAVAFSDLIIMNMLICRNTGSLAGDLADTYFVLFMIKIESCII